jgi:hypothetical protein
MDALVIPVTSLVKEYRQVNSLSQREQVEQAHGLMADAATLPMLFADSVEEFRDWDNVCEPFHPERHGRTPHRRSHTALFAQALKDARRPIAAGHLDFAYVDYELVPTRKTGGARFEDGASPRTGVRLDLLLRNDADGYPIVAEVKVGQDKTPLVALIQALTAAALLATGLQRRRLQAHYADADLATGDRLDVYLIFLDEPSRGRYREELNDATDRIARAFVEDVTGGKFVRRIACLSGAHAGTSLALRWAYGDGC